MIYTVIYSSSQDCEDAPMAKICVGADWWAALANANVVREFVIAMVPGEHRGTIMFNHSQAKVRCPLERRLTVREAA